MKHLLHRITLMVAAVMLAISASAVKFEYKGVFYNLDLDSKTASVTYTGETPEGNTYSGEISITNKFKYEGEYYRVTSIGEKAFYGCDGIVYVKIGGLVTSIASQAFGNNSMKSLIIPSQVATIAEDAFSGSSIDIFTPEALADYSFLKGVSTSAKVFAPEASLEGIRALWSGTVKSIAPHYYLEDLSTMSEARFRLHKTEYYSLPDAEPFEFSSVITHGVEIFPNEEGVYSWGNLSLGQLCEFQINYSLDYEDIGATEHIAAKPLIQCEEAAVNAGVFTANIAAEENAAYSPIEKGVYVDGTKYAADAAGKVTVDALAADAEYIAKPYAIYKGKTYYGAEFVISTKNATGISGAAADIKFTFNNLSKNGYIEVATTAAGDVAYFIMNITGQKEKEGTIDGDGKVNTVSTAELSSGIYLLNVSGAGITKTVKFVIK